MLTVIFTWGQKHLGSVTSLREPGSGSQSEKAWSFCSCFLKEAQEHGGEQVSLNSSFWAKTSPQSGKEMGEATTGSLALCVQSLLKKRKLFILSAPLACARLTLQPYRCSYPNIDAHISFATISAMPPW